MNTPSTSHLSRAVRTLAAALLASYEKVRAEKFCPRDAWILVNE